MTNTSLRVLVSTYLTPEDVRALDERAKAEDRSRAQVVRMILTAAIHGPEPTAVLNGSTATGKKPTAPSGSALETYRAVVCQAEGHTHGKAGELDCLLAQFAQQNRLGA